MGRASALVATFTPEDSFLLLRCVGLAPERQARALDVAPDLIDGPRCGVFALFHLALGAVYAKRRAEERIVLSDETHAFRRGRRGRR